MREGHVTVDLLVSIVPRAAARVQAVVVHLASAAALALISWRLVIRSMDQRTYEEVTDELFLELWPFSAVMATLCAIAALAALANSILSLTGRKAWG